MPVMLISAFPAFATIPHRGVENGEQLAHTGGDGDFWLLPVGDEALVEFRASSGLCRLAKRAAI